MVAPLRDPVCLDRVFLELGALTWPNGFDRSPEALHADIAEAEALIQSVRACFDPITASHLSEHAPGMRRRLSAALGAAPDLRAP